MEKEKKIKLKCSICKKVVVKVKVSKLIIPFEVGCKKCLKMIKKDLDKLADEI